jgi:hypothetical protein
VYNFSPNYFTDIDFENPAHNDILAKSPDNHDFHVLEKHGIAAFSYLCESWLSRAILDNVRQTFCIGTDDALCQTRANVDHALLALERFVKQQPDATGQWPSTLISPAP